MKLSESNSAFLIKRIKQNEKYQSLNFNEWIFSEVHLKKRPTRILELCCGTGRQTKFLAGLMAEGGQITAVDLSLDSIQLVKNTYINDQINLNLVVADIDEFMANNEEKFDLVFCSYGLYYSKNIPVLLDNIYNSLNDIGSLIVVGPYGDNNKPLFDLLKSCDVSFDKLVTYSSSDFMYKDVLHSGYYKKYQKTYIRKAINHVEWQSVEDIITYWKNSTFFDEKNSNKVSAALYDHFATNDRFVNEKHIMFIQHVRSN